MQALFTLVLLLTLQVQPTQQQQIRVVDDVASCLSSRTNCVNDRECSLFYYQGTECLATPVPAQLATNLERISCCFRCCLQFHLHVLKLDAVSLKSTHSQLHRAFTDPITQQAIKQVVTPSPRQSAAPDSIIFSALTSSIAISSHVLTMVGAAERSPVLRIAAMTGITSVHSWMDPSLPIAMGSNGGGGYASKHHRNANRLPWSSLKGSDITLLTPTLTKCVNVPFSNLRSLDNTVYRWFSTQLPCQALHSAPTANSSDTASSSPTTSKAWNAAPDTGMLHLMPTGVRHPPSLAAALLLAPKVSSKQRLLDCTCAKQIHGNASWAQPVLSALAPLCAQPLSKAQAARYSSTAPRAGTAEAAQPTTDGSQNDGGGRSESDASQLLRQLVREQDQVLEQRLVVLRAYYGSIVESEFVLSLSAPGALGPCEWEAIASGSKVVMAAHLHKQLLEHPLTAELYAGLPVTLLPNDLLFSSPVGPRTERSTTAFAALLRSAPPVPDASASIASVYLPFWLHRLSQGLIRGKPHHHMHEFRRSAQTYASASSSASAAADSALRSCPDPSASSATPSLGPASSTKTTTNNNNNHNHDAAPNQPPLLLEFVVPLCCEQGHEVAWLQALGSLPSVSLSLYYKCPHCLPVDLAASMLKGIPETIGHGAAVHTPHGVQLLHEFAPQPRSVAGIAPHKLQQQQQQQKQQSTSTSTNTHTHTHTHVVASQRRALFDLHQSNSKEVAAYLSHIVERYDSLAPHTIFLHASPETHAHFDLFFRAVSHALYCKQDLNPPLLFASLNFLYRSGVWGQCCGGGGGGGDVGSCKKATWAYLFARSDDLVGSTGTGTDSSRGHLADSVWNATLLALMPGVSDRTKTKTAPGSNVGEGDRGKGRERMAELMERDAERIEGRARAYLRRNRKGPDLSRDASVSVRAVSVSPLIGAGAGAIVDEEGEGEDEDEGDQGPEQSQGLAQGEHLDSARAKTQTTKGEHLDSARAKTHTTKGEHLDSARAKTQTTNVQKSESASARLALAARLKARRTSRQVSPTQQQRKHLHTRKKKQPLHIQDQQQQQQQQLEGSSRRRLSSSLQQLSLQQQDVIEDVKFARANRHPLDFPQLQRGWNESHGSGFAAYSSAQFIVSRSSLRSVPRELWLKMLLAINGSHPLAGCALSTKAGDAHGGHQLTGQYERMWHILFGYPRRQGMRSHDSRLPHHLRVDCKPFGEGLCQAELRAPRVPNSETMPLSLELRRRRRKSKKRGARRAEEGI